MEMQERRAKRLCYNCDQKFTLEHRCKKIFLIEACYDGDNDVVMDKDDAIIEIPQWCKDPFTSNFRSKDIGYNAGKMDY